MRLPARTAFVSPATAPVPSPTAPLLAALDARDSVVTVISTAGSSSTSSASSSSSSSPSLVGPIVGGLVGGIGAGLIIAGLWWYCAKRSAQQKAEARLRYQRRKAKKAGASVSARPSASSSRKTSGAHLTTLAEKDYAHDYVPTLPPTREDAHGHGHGAGQRKHSAGPISPLPGLPKEHGYGYAPQQYANAPVPAPQQQYPSPHGQYAGQPDLPPEHGQYYFDPSDAAQYVADNHDTPAAPVQPASAVAPAPAQRSSTKASRSAARVAVAEKSVAAASAPLSERHKPVKRSPLAAAAQPAPAPAPGWGDGPFRLASPPTSPGADRDREELADSDVQYRANQANGTGNDTRVTSGEWGVALGSPDHDGSFAQQQQRQTLADHAHVHDADNDRAGVNVRAADPYLANALAASGQYSADPYAAYHGTDKSAWI
ncbi:hypothetical protein Q5752_002224 [Cryptotrichosporon argae]